MKLSRVLMGLILILALLAGPVSTSTARGNVEQRAARTSQEYCDLFCFVYADRAGIELQANVSNWYAYFTVGRGGKSLYAGLGGGDPVDIFDADAGAAGEYSYTLEVWDWNLQTEAWEYGGTWSLGPIQGGVAHGSLRHNTTWNGGEWWVKGEVKVEEGVTLTVTPGTSVRAETVYTSGIITLQNAHFKADGASLQNIIIRGSGDSADTSSVSVQNSAFEYTKISAPRVGAFTGNRADCTNPIGWTGQYSFGAPLTGNRLEILGNILPGCRLQLPLSSPTTYVTIAENTLKSVAIWPFGSSPLPYLGAAYEIEENVFTPSGGISIFNLGSGSLSIQGNSGQIGTVELKDFSPSATSPQRLVRGNGTIEKILLDGANEVTLEKNYLSDTGLDSTGIQIVRGRGNQVRDNEIIRSSSGYAWPNVGVAVGFADNDPAAPVSDTVVADNRIEGFAVGIGLGAAQNSLVKNNIVQKNGTGIQLGGYTYNSYTYGEAAPSGNRIYNNFFSNTRNFKLDLPCKTGGCVNEWNLPQTFEENIITGPYQGGNYWGGDSPQIYTGPDANRDGLGDEPFVISPSQQDHLPLVMPAPLVVNSVADKNDLAGNDGACHTGDFILRAGVQEPECTLRAALQEANSAPGKDRITFNIPNQPATPTLRPYSALPRATGPVEIDATTQPGTQAVILSGSLTSAGPGLVLAGTNNQVRGLTLEYFKADGLLLEMGALELDRVTLQYNCGWGIWARGQVAIGFRGYFPIAGSQNLIRDNGLCQGEAAGGVYVRGSVSAYATTLSGNGGPGLIAQSQIRLLGVQALNNLGEGIQSQKGPIEIQAAGSAQANRVSGNRGRGIVAGYELSGCEIDDEAPAGGISLDVAGALEVSDNASWGIYLGSSGSLHTLVTEPIVISGNGKGLECWEWNEAKPGGLIGERLPVCRGGGLLSAGGVSLTNVTLHANGGPGVLAVCPVELINPIITANRGEGAKSLSSVTIASTIGTAQINTNLGSGVQAGQGLSINGATQVNANSGWGAWSGDYVDVRGATVSFNANGKTSECWLWNPNENGVRLEDLDEFIACQADRVGGGLFGAAMVEGINLTLSNNGGPGLMAGGRVELVDVQSQFNQGSGIQSEVEIVLHRTAQGQGVISDNWAEGVFSSEGQVRLWGYPFTIQRNYSHGVAADQNIYIGIESPQIISRPQWGQNLISNNGSGEVCYNWDLDDSLGPVRHLYPCPDGGDGVHSELGRIEAYSIQAQNNSGFGLNTQGEVYLNGARVCNNTAGGVRAGGKIWLYNTTLCGNARHAIQRIPAGLADPRRVTDNDALIFACQISGNSLDGVNNGLAGLKIAYTNLSENGGLAVRTLPETPVTAANNWWGSASGPGGAGSGTGDEVSAGVSYTPWQTAPVSLAASPLHSPAYAAPGVNTPVEISLVNWSAPTDTVTLSVQDTRGWVRPFGSDAVALSDSVAIAALLVRPPQDTPAGSSDWVSLTARSTLDPAQVFTTSFEVIAAPLADLQASVSAQSARFAPGEPLSLTYTLTNAGPSPASAVTATLTLPAGASLQNIQASQGTCDSSASPVCSLGQINAGAAVTLTASLLPGSAGWLSAGISAATSTRDPNEWNNAASLEVRIVPPPVVGVKHTTYLPQGRR